MRSLIFHETMPNTKVPGLMDGENVFCYCKKEVADEIIALYKKNERKAYSKSNLPERKQKFSSLVMFHGSHLYPMDKLQRFISYWTEHGENDIKMRFEKQVSFDIKRRLANFKDYGAEPKEKKMAGRMTGDSVKSTFTNLL